MCGPLEHLNLSWTLLRALFILGGCGGYQNVRSSHAVVAAGMTGLCGDAGVVVDHDATGIKAAAICVTMTLSALSSTLHTVSLARTWHACTHIHVRPHLHTCLPPCMYASGPGCLLVGRVAHLWAVWLSSLGTAP